MKSSLILVIVLYSLLSAGQQVHVSPVKGGVILSISAQKPYQLLPGEDKLPQLGVECIHKGNKDSKNSHTVIFSPGGSVVADNPEAGGKGAQGFIMTIDGKKQGTLWSSFGESAAFAYAGKTEAERMQFIHTLLDAKTVSIEFKPFLTGYPTTSTFDVSELRETVQNQPECAMK